MSYTLLKIPYATWSQIKDANNFAVYQEIVSSDNRRVWCGNLDYIYECFVDVDSYVTTYSGTHGASAVQVVDRDDAIARIVGLSRLPQLRSGGRQITMSYPTEGSYQTIISTNWCDPCSWYQKSVIHRELLSPVVSGTTYSCSHTSIIDTLHGRISKEDFLSDGYGGNYRASFYVDEGEGFQLKTEVDPHTESGDYVVDYENGTVTFSPSISATATVSGNYFYANGSTYTVAPTSGKVLKVKNVEVQFSSDVELTDTVVFKAYGYADVFAPHLVPSVFPPGTKIKLSELRYKTIDDYINESNKALPQIPPLSSGTWRGSQQSRVVFPWDYTALLPLSSAAGMEIRISTQHEIPIGGSFVTATFYCLSEDE